MNQTQRKHAVNRLVQAADKSIVSLYNQYSDMRSKYSDESNPSRIQLEKAIVASGTPASLISENELREMFSALRQENIENSNTAPDMYRVSVRKLTEFCHPFDKYYAFTNSYADICYQAIADKMSKVVELLNQAIDQIMIGSSEEALDTIKGFEKQLAKV